MEDQKSKTASGSNQEAIVEIVKAIPRGDHLTAPEVFELAKGHGLKVSLSTVYRTLSRLKAGGDVITVSGDRGLRYEAAEEGPAHDHLICLGCGTTIEFYDELIRGFGKTVAQRKGFDHTTSRFDILGYCQSCRSNDEGRRIDQVEVALTSAIDRSQEALSQMSGALDSLRNRKFSRVSQPLKSAILQLSQSIEYIEEASNHLTAGGNIGAE
jgi:Fur family ferric uptake transcriptional regulator